MLLTAWPAGELMRISPVVLPGATVKVTLVAVGVPVMVPATPFTLTLVVSAR